MPARPVDFTLSHPLLSARALETAVGDRDGERGVQGYRAAGALAGVKLSGRGALQAQLNTSAQCAPGRC